jgi:predicted CxxxxCH...CXXCH cytochrome family protein
VPSNKNTGDNLESTDEVLDSTSLQLFWYADTNKWYDYDCSECHYDSTAPTAGLGTYGMSKHVDANYDVAFDVTASGIASKGGTYSVQAGDAGAWSPGNNTCYGIWCHSDGYERDAGDSPGGNGRPDWSGTGIFDDPTDYDFHTVRPEWTDTTRTTVNCNSCHYGADKPADASDALDKPNTGAHRKVAQHATADQHAWHGNSDAVPCLECHWRYDTYGTANENQWWRPYGSYEHVNGAT